MTVKSIPCACAVKLWTRSRFTDRTPGSLSENCDDPSRSRSPGSAGGARIHPTLDLETMPLQRKKRKRCVRRPGERFFSLIRRGTAARSHQMRTESPPLDKPERQGCVLPSRSLAPSPSLSLSLSRRFSLQFLGTRLWRLAASLKATSPCFSAWLGWYRHQEAARNFGWFPHRNLFKTQRGPRASPGIERCEYTVILLQVSGTSSSSSSVTATSYCSTSLCR